MRNRFHSICPYFAMFPELFVRKHLVWSRPGDLVLDPFSGRGTTVFESLLGDRDALGGDTNDVAVCVAGAKADPPRLQNVLSRIDNLEQSYKLWDGAEKSPVWGDEFFSVCFSKHTLRQILFLRHQLRWRDRRADRLIAAVLLGCLHGESHRSPWYLSNRMPRTISTKPAYSVRWWRARGLRPPARNVFTILREVSLFRYQSPLPARRGRVIRSDARELGARLPHAKGRVALMVTSPPYLDTTNYREDQWLRLWMLGGPPSPDPRRKDTDDRHRDAEKYWAFLTSAWNGVASLLMDGAHIVIRIGGRRVDSTTVAENLRRSLKDGLGASLRLRERRSSRIVNGQLHAFRPGVKGTQVEHDFHYQIT
jgi:hypothetical protein